MAQTVVRIVVDASACEPMVGRLRDLVSRAPKMTATQETAFEALCQRVRPHLLEREREGETVRFRPGPGLYEIAGFIEAVAA